MIAADDMRPELGCYGCTHMKTPHLDALAQDSLVFDRAYVAVAWCSPSRTALLTSRRADTSRTWSVVPTEYWRQRGGNFTTLTQHFVERGFLALGMGKIFHPGAASGNNDVRYSWSPESLPYDGDGTSCPTGGPDPAVADSIPQPNAMGGPAMSPAANGDTALAGCGVRTINQLAAKRKSGVDKRPFFLAVGFVSFSMS
jgi:iduronate 2-sulfatase